MKAGAQSDLFSEELARVGWHFSSVFVLEIGVHVHALAKPGIEAFSPGSDLLRSVVFKAQAGVGEAGSKHVGRCLLVGLGQAKGRLVLTKNGIRFVGVPRDRKSTRLNSSHGYISYAVFCLKKKKLSYVQTAHTVTSN